MARHGCPGRVLSHASVPSRAGLLLDFGANRSRTVPSTPHHPLPAMVITISVKILAVYTNMCILVYSGSDMRGGLQLVEPTAAPLVGVACLEPFVNIPHAASKLHAGRVSLISCRSDLNSIRPARRHLMGPTNSHSGSSSLLSKAAALPFETNRSRAEGTPIASAKLDRSEHFTRVTKTPCSHRDDAACSCRFEDRPVLPLETEPQRAAPAAPHRGQVAPYS